jgi:preprotein translocase subunit YajC
MAEELIPIVMFISLALVFIFLFWFRYKARVEMQATFRQALEKGQDHRSARTSEAIQR